MAAEGKDVTFKQDVYVCGYLCWHHQSHGQMWHSVISRSGPLQSTPTTFIPTPSFSFISDFLLCVGPPMHRLLYLCIYKPAYSLVSLRSFSVLPDLRSFSILPDLRSFSVLPDLHSVLCPPWLTIPILPDLRPFANYFPFSLCIFHCPSISSVPTSDLNS